MTKLDREISELFKKKMIKSWDKISNIKGGVIEFDNGLSISAYKKSSKNDNENRENMPLQLNIDTFSHPFATCYWNVVIPDTDKLLFCINTPYRHYNVPEHDRHTYVEVLDILDSSIRKFEEKKLEEYRTYFK